MNKEMRLQITDTEKKLGVANIDLELICNRNEKKATLWHKIAR